MSGFCETVLSSQKESGLEMMFAEPSGSKDLNAMRKVL
jgi:hypothetical protein